MERLEKDEVVKDLANIMSQLNYVIDVVRSNTKHDKKSTPIESKWVIITSHTRKLTYISSINIDQDHLDIIVSADYLKDRNILPTIGNTASLTGLAVSTTLRKIKTLEKMGILQKIKDSDDARRRLVTLSERGQEIVNNFVAHMCRSDAESVLIERSCRQ